MSMDGIADSRVKPELLKDTFKLIDFEPYEVFNERELKKRPSRKIDHGSFMKNSYKTNDAS